MKKMLLLILLVLSLMVAGCSGDETETTTYTDEDGVEVTTTVPVGEEDSWCPVGATWEAANPQTGESMMMEIVGTETVDGVEMCKAVVEIEPPADGIAMMEYLWD